MPRNPYTDGQPFSVAALNSQKHAHDGEAVASGCACSPGTNSWDVDVESGTVVFGSRSVDVAATTVTHASADSNDRVDLVTADTSGAVSITEGSQDTTSTNGDQPVAPAIPSDEVLLAAVYVRGGSSEILAGDVYEEYRTRVDEATLDGSHRPGAAGARQYGGGSDGWVVPSGTRLVEAGDGPHVALRAFDWFQVAVNGTSDGVPMERLAYDDASGTLWGSDADADGDGQTDVAEYSVSGAASQLTSWTTTNGETGLAIAHDGTSVWVGDSSSSRLYKYDESGAYQSESIDVGLTLLRAAHWDDVRSEWLVAGYMSSPSRAVLARYDPATSSLTEIANIEAAANEDQPTGVFRADRDYFVTGNAQNEVHRFAPDGSYLGSVPTGYNNVGGGAWLGNRIAVGISGSSAWEEYTVGGSQTSGHDVAIDVGEGFVGGTYLASDTQPVVSLAASTTNQTVYLGTTSTPTGVDVKVGLDSAFDAGEPKIPIWEFDTDSSTVTGSRDLRQFDRALDADVVRATPVDVRNVVNPEQGWVAYHDGSGSNTEGLAQYTSGGSWESVVDGTTIS